MSLASDLTTGDQNVAARRALTDLVCDERALLFAGAGVSVSAEYPGWTRLLRELELVCDHVGPGFVRDGIAILEDPIRYADAIKEHITRCTGDLARYSAYLVNVFSRSPRLQSFHYDLVSLPFRGFVTTNYDSTLEAALAQIELHPPDKTVIVLSAPGPIIRTYHTSLSSNRHARLVAHLHGHYRQPESIVLSAGDYAIAYGLDRPPAIPPRFDTPTLVSFLQVVLAGWSLVFVGFSFRDPRLEVFLDAASKRYGLWNSSTHYALMPTTDLSAVDDKSRAARLKAEYGIDTVFYEQAGNSHDQLYELVKDIRETCGGTSPDILPDVNKRTIPGMRV